MLNTGTGRRRAGLQPCLFSCLQLLYTRLPLGLFQYLSCLSIIKMVLTGACDKIAIRIWTKVTHSTNNVCLCCYETNEAAIQEPGDQERVEGAEFVISLPRKADGKGFCRTHSLTCFPLIQFWVPTRIACFKQMLHGLHLPWREVKGSIHWQWVCLSFVEASDSYDCAWWTFPIMYSKDSGSWSSRGYRFWKTRCR